MDPSALPTDNLYKFMALSGLAVAGFCVWFWWTRSRQLAHDRHQVRVYRAEQRDKIERVERRAEDFQRRFESKVSRLDALDTRVSEHAEDQRELARAADALNDQIAAEMDSEHQKNLEAIDEAYDVARKISSERARIDEEQERFDGLGIGLLFGVGLGISVSLAGFVLWHIKLQGHLDELTEHSVREQKAKADLAELELRRASGSR